VFAFDLNFHEPEIHFHNLGCLAGACLEPSRSSHALAVSSAKPESLSLIGSGSGRGPEIQEQSEQDFH
jgi:hypothetical protein